MTDLPNYVELHEEGPREGFQIEPGPIPTGEKLRLIEALAETGLHHIQVCSFVSPKVVPGWADADAVVAGLRPRPVIAFSAFWFNAKGLARTLATWDALTLFGSISLSASEALTRRNLHRTHEENLLAMREMSREHLAAGIAVKRTGVMAAFGCNYQGDIAPGQVIRTLQDGFAIAAEFGVAITDLSLADMMGWAARHCLERVLDGVRAHWPDSPIRLHLTTRAALQWPTLWPGCAWASCAST